MPEPQDETEEDARHATPYRPEDFTKAQYVPPTYLQRQWAQLKITGALVGVLIVVALCARVAGIA